MPVYEYECLKCLKRFELKKHFGENGKAVCPQCQNEARRLFSPVPIVFKGSGFYVTDNRKESWQNGYIDKGFTDNGKLSKSKSEKKEDARF